MILILDLAKSEKNIVVFFYKIKTIVIVIYCIYFLKALMCHLLYSRFKFLWDLWAFKNLTFKVN
jgi:hypothetical protein